MNTTMPLDVLIQKQQQTSATEKITNTTFKKNKRQ